MRYEPKRQKPVVTEPEELKGLVMGRGLEGDQVLHPLPSGEALWRSNELFPPALLLGASGSGKTETIKRLLYEVATKEKNWRFAVIDAKGDEKLAEWVLALAKETGRKARLFPHEPFAGWRGDWKAIVNRLLQVIAYAESGPAAFYRDIAKTVLQTACRSEDGAPDSSIELLERLSKTSLASVSGGKASAALTDDLVIQMRMRYEAFFGQVGTALDGDWAWEDTDVAYFLLDSLGTEEDAASAAAYLFTDFGHYFKHRKPRDQRCVLAVDEFAAIARTGNVAMLVEQARSFGAFLLLAPQTISGMGSPEQQSRILGSVDMLVCHRTKEPERIVEIAGEQEMASVTQAIEEGRRTGRGHVQLQTKTRLKPGQLRGLRPGEAWFIRDDKAQKVAIAATETPKVEIELPEAKNTDLPLEKKEVGDDVDKAKLGNPPKGRDR